MYFWFLLELMFVLIRAPTKHPIQLQGNISFITNTPISYPLLPYQKYKAHNHMHPKAKKTSIKDHYLQKDP